MRIIAIGRPEDIEELSRGGGLVVGSAAFGPAGEPVPSAFFNAITNLPDLADEGPGDEGPRPCDDECGCESAEEPREERTLQVWLNATDEPYEFETTRTAAEFVEAVDDVLEAGTRWVLAGDFYLRSNQVAAVTEKPGDAE